MSSTESRTLLDGLNDAQQRAVSHDDGPLLIAAGAGTGKTTTLARRVAWLVDRGVDPGRILLLTFTRRSAAEMIRRADALLAAGGKGQAARSVWGGTFHSVAVRLLRSHGPAIGLPSDFTILDRTDSEDLFGSLRAALGYSEAGSRFPAAAACAAIYGRVVNSQRPLDEVLKETNAALLPQLVDLKAIFRAYTTRKEREHLLDYDDLLLFWDAMLVDPVAGSALQERFTHVLVDEFQDTNRLQASILKRLRPDGAGVTVVGDDAQAIYAFRAATVRNILDFPQEFPSANVVALEQNYRSTQQILDVANAVMRSAKERHEKSLRATRSGGGLPTLVRCHDEDAEAVTVVDRILALHDDGIALAGQAVLFRASHQSLKLELELNRRGIPYRKYGGLKLLEAAHVKDLLAFLRLAENPRDSIAAERVLLMLPGIGRKTAKILLDRLADAGFRLPLAWNDHRPTAAGRERWNEFLKLVDALTTASATGLSTAEQVSRIRVFYQPLAQDRFDDAATRMADLEQLEHFAAGYENRAAYLADLTLDPPASTERRNTDEDDGDCLVLSTVHSAKGLEFDAVHLLSAIEGSFPSSMSAETPESIDEERRLFYVALTRARTHLFLYQPLRYAGGRSGGFFGGGLTTLTRFLDRDIQQQMTILSTVPASESTVTTGDVRQQIGRLWE